MANLVIVSNRLPMSVKKVNGKLEFGQGMGGLATGLSGYTKQRGTKWVGWPGIPSDDLTKAEMAQITRELRKQRCYPVFLTSQQITDYYNGYSNSVIWPLFHDLDVKPHTKQMWKAYKEVNAVFSEEVLRLSKPGSTIWVHDYQLMLLPQLLRRAGRRDQIGFFLHIPFPSPKTMETTEESASLIRGVLGADLVGFHTRGYTHDFLATCDKLLGLESQSGKLLIGERTVSATEFPMGIDYSRFAAATRQRSRLNELRKLHWRYRGKKVIVTVDRLDITKGLVERLKAYQMLLRQQPRWHGKLVMAMIVAPSRTDIPEYKALKGKLDKILAEINKEFATPKWQPVDFMYESVPLDSVMMYYKVGDVAFIAPIKDGMNLVAKEFIAAKRRNNGVLVLSKTAGAAEELQGAIQVDPKRLQTMVDGLQQALTLPKRELRERARAMQKHIQQFTVQHWAESFMDVLQRSRSLGVSYTRPMTKAAYNEIVAMYHQAKHRLFLLDYDGVLVKMAKTPDAAQPTEEMMAILRTLTDDPANEVVIISGRPKTDLQTWFGDLPIALAAEHGALFRRKGGKNWHKSEPGDRVWKHDVKQVLEYFGEQTPGAFVEQKEWGLTWHYRAASPYAAQKNLVALKRLLKPIAREYDLRVQDGHKNLEVRPRGIHKGRIAQEWLIHDHDFVLCSGDDITDEDMFRVLPLKAYSVRVGRGKTLARFRMHTPAAFLRLLSRLSG